MENELSIKALYDWTTTNTIDMAEKSPSKRNHVVKRGSGWAVKKEGNKRATKVYTSKKEAIEGAKESKKQGYDLVIHKKDGSIQKWEKSNKK